jgi:hypothetical protein
MLELRSATAMDALTWDQRLEAECLRQEAEQTLKGR